MNTDAARHAALLVEARESLHFYTRYMFAKRRGYKWRDNWHHKLLCEKLEKVFQGEIKRLIICMPPRYSKTEIAVVNFISWALGKVPDAEFIHVSYADGLATNNSGLTKDLVQTEAYQEIFPDIKISKDNKGKGDWRTTSGGTMYATGAKGTITGFGAGKMREGFGGAIIIDDPHKPDEATSDIIRKGVLEFFGNTLESRLNSPDTPIILIMQRLHETDLAGWLMNGGNGEDWDVLCIPAFDEERNPLWEFKHDKEALERMEKSKPYVFAGQYMQRPAPLGGGIFKNDWWRYYSMLPAVKRIIQSWDTAFKTKESSDFSVCTTWAECENGYYLIDLYKEKVEFPMLKVAATTLAKKYNPNVILIEDKASGQSLIQELRRGTTLPLIAVKADTDKVSRATAVTPLIESGRVFLPEEATWKLEYIHSLASFPNAAHDDDVDSTTQALNYMARGGGKTGLLDYYAEEVRKMKTGEAR